MLVSAFDDYRPQLESTREKRADEGWLVRNLRLSSAYPKDPFNMKEHNDVLRAKRLRIAGGFARELKNYLKSWFQFTPATVYLDFEKVELL
jgi:hypothetical protein